MTVEAEVLDPRVDREPVYWAGLRGRAGLRADWDWGVLGAQAWCARTPQLVTVLHADGEPAGVVSSAWVSTSTRRHRFVGSLRGGRLGGLDVRAPGTSAVPGWWFADAGDDDGCGVLLDRFVPAVRRELGLGLRGMLVRQVSAAGSSTMDGRFRLLRKTEDVADLHTSPFADVDSWVASLRKRRRANIRQVIASVGADPGVEVITGSLADADPAEAAKLLRANAGKHHDVPIVPLPLFVGYLARLFRRPDVLGIRYLEPGTGRLLGIALLLDHPRWPVMRAWAGLPIEDGGRPNLYFHVYTEGVRLAIELGRDGLLLGKKYATLKKTLGATLVPQYAAAIPL